MNLILFDDDSRIDLLPLTFTRPAADLRIGILTIREKWEHYWKLKSSSLTVDYLSAKFPCITESDNLLVNGRLIPDPDLLRALESLQTGQTLVDTQGAILGSRLDESGARSFNPDSAVKDKVDYPGRVEMIRYPWDLFSKNAGALEADFDLITSGRKSQTLSSTNTLLGDRIFAEEGASAECAVLNARHGAIYLGKDSEVMEGSVVRGGLALCEHSTLKMSTKIYGATTIGPHSKVGGELNNSVILGYANKAHDGFLGNSVIGEWCNLGADTNNSNLKNNYAEVKLWSYRKNSFIRTGLQFCGLIMGDHSKCGINTMFNTGTVVGVSANIFGAGFPRNLIPSFSWGGAQGFETYTLNKVFEVAQKVMEHRGLELNQTEKDILSHIFEQSREYRFWEKQILNA